MANKILVVDDDAILVRALSMVLRHNGFEVLAALSGEQAVAVVAKDHPDLVLLDLTMPGMDGWEVCRKIRAAGNTPVILLSGRQISAPEIAQKLGNVSVSHYLVKPVRNEALLEAVKAALA